MNPIIPVPVAAQGEIVELRTVRSKTFDMGGQRRRLISRIELVHYVDPMTGQLEDVNTDIVEEAGGFRVSKAWYDLTIPTSPATPTPVALSYASKRGGVVTVTLVAVDDIPISRLLLTLSPRIRGNELWWENVRPDLDIILSASPGHIELYKRLRTPFAPARFTWEITTTSGHASFQRQTFARDASPEKREVRVITTITGPSSDRGRELYVYREDVTRETIVEDPRTRIRSVRPLSETVYPILVDVQVLEDIVANNDDGNTRISYGDWQDGTLVYATSVKLPGFRFVSVPVPQGATIDAPTQLTYLIITATSDTGTLYGYDTDSAAAWSNSIRPGLIAQTTASVALACTPAGWATLDVRAIVQEIVNRPGWASGNNMSLGANNTVGGDTTVITAYNYQPANSANLEINYTAGGAQNKMRWGIGMGVGGGGGANARPGVIG